MHRDPPDDTGDPVIELTSTRLQHRPGERTRTRLARVVLEVLRGADVGKRFDLTAPRLADGRAYDGGSSRAVVGRAPQHDVVLTDKSISTTHFELTIAADHVVLRDLDSRNGTWIGHAKLLGPMGLVDGAEFEAGECRFRLHCGDTIEIPIAADAHFGAMRGSSPAMRELFATLARLAPKPITTLLLGETGTGKEEVARALHEASGRAGPFIVLDCAALPRDLAEATILGHRKGAFTGAVADQPGAFEAADGGTLFIDEIGELPLDLQPKLLRVLQRREVQRVGEHHARAVDVRVLSATHRDLRRAIAQDEFRPDLYYRLAQFVIAIPALRDRSEDVVPLARYFVDCVARETHRDLVIAEDAARWLEGLHWEGNVRQLRLAMECAAHLAAGTIIRRADIMIHDAHVADVGAALPLKDAAARVTDAYLRQGCERVMAATGGNVEQAARLAGYTGRGFRDVLKRLGLRTTDESESS
jgi:transcriptional regulator with PAS, ATPase and Fis domain